jgi:hypothetical protein
MTPTQTGEYIIPVDAIIAKGRELAPGSQLSDEDAHSIGKLFFDQETTKLKQAAGNPVPPRNAGVQVGMPQGFAEGGMSLNDQATAPIGIPPVVQPTAPPTPSPVQPAVGSGLFLGAPGTPTVQAPPRPGYDEGGLVVDDKIDRPENRFEPAVGMPVVPSSESMRTGGIEGLSPTPAPKAPVTHDIADPEHLANADNTRAIAIQQAAGGQGNVPVEMLPAKDQPNSPLNPANHPSVGTPGIGLGGNKGISLTPSTTDMSTNADGSFKTPHAPPAPGTGIMQVEGQKPMDVGNMGPTQGIGVGINAKTGLPQGMSAKPSAWKTDGTPVHEAGGIHYENKGSASSPDWQEVPKGTELQRVGGKGGMQGTPLPELTDAGIPDATGKLPGALEGISKGDQELIKKIVNYDKELPKGRVLTDQYWKSILQRAVQYDPSFSERDYNSRMALRKDFTSGKSANAIRSLNTAIGHLNSLSESAKALDNGSYQYINSARNWLREKSGDDKVDRFKVDATALEGEMANVFKNSGATDQEIKVWRERLDASKSPEQFKAIVGEAIKLMGSRMEALDSQYNAGMGKPREFAVLNAKSRQILKGLGADPDSMDAVSVQGNQGTPAVGMPQQSQKANNGPTDLSHFLTEAKKHNPNASEQELTAYYNKEYGGK